MKCLKIKIIGVFFFLVQMGIAQSSASVQLKTNVSIDNALSDRKIEKANKIDNVSATVGGQVCVSVCIDSEGNISKAAFRPQGSTTINKELVTAAINNANSYKFSSSELQKQCGIFTYRFTVQ